MLKMVSTIVLALVLGATAAAAVPPTQSARTMTNLNMRAGPGTQHEVLAWIPKGTWIAISGCTNPVAWCQTTFNNRQGWVSANYLDPRPNAGTQPPPVPPSGGAHAPAGVPLFGPGFRTPDDLCRRAGESDFTNQFLGGSSELVACPPGTDPRLFAFETGGQEVARRDGWILFTVPHGGASAVAPSGPPADVPLFGPGFRSPDDQCRRAGESDFTNQFLGGGTYLVACPPGTDPGTFSDQTHGQEVARRDGWILFTVPHH